MQCNEIVWDVYRWKLLTRCVVMVKWPTVTHVTCWNIQFYIPSLFFWFHGLVTGCQCHWTPHGLTCFALKSFSAKTFHAYTHTETRRPLKISEREKLVVSHPALSQSQFSLNAFLFLFPGWKIFTETSWLSPAGTNISTDVIWPAHVYLFLP